MYLDLKNQNWARIEGWEIDTQLSFSPAPQKMSQDPSVVIGAAAAVTVVTGLMVRSVETVSQVSSRRMSADFLREQDASCPVKARGWGSVGV